MMLCCSILYNLTDVKTLMTVYILRTNIESVNKHRGEYEDLETRVRFV